MTSGDDLLIQEIDHFCVSWKNIELGTVAGA